jgi:methyl-accepting chemotaxis protein
VRHHLMAGFGLMVVVFLCIAALTILTTRSIDSALSENASENSLVQRSAINFRGSAHDRSIAVRDVVLAKTSEDRSRELENIRRLAEFYGKSAGDLDRLISTVKTLPPEVASLYQQIQAAEKLALEATQKTIDLTKEGNSEAALKVLWTEAKPRYTQWLASINKLIDFEEVRILQNTASATQKAGNFAWLTLGVTAAAVLIAVVTSILLTRSIIGVMGDEPSNVRHAVERMRDGDLATAVAVKPGDSSSVLAALADMQSTLVDLVGGVRQNAEGVATASAQIAQGNNDLSARTEEQASALEQTAASMEELSSTVKQNADNARQGNQLALSASAVAVKGGEVVSQVVQTMKGINDASKRIADIIGVIDGIAFQTNILALNAAVEAARAGEQGRGFAVVASEVRSLAGRSADAAKEIKGLISTSVERVAQGTTLVDQAGATMTEVVSSIQRVTDIMGEISAASTEQSAGVAQVGEAVTQMDQATQQNAALVEQSAAAAESLKSQAQQLVQAVAVFQLAQNKGAYLSTAGAHRPAPTAAMLAPSMRAGYAATQRRSLNKSQNVKRLPVKGSTTSEPTQVATRKTGTDDDWTAF